MDARPNQFRRCTLLVHQDDRASTFPSTYVGKDQALKQLHKSTRTGLNPPIVRRCRREKKNSTLTGRTTSADRQRADLLAEFHDPQVQATRDQDHAVPHQNAPREAPHAVRICPSSSSSLLPQMTPVLTCLQTQTRRYQEKTGQTRGRTRAQSTRSRTSGAHDREGAARAPEEQGVWRRAVKRERERVGGDIGQGKGPGARRRARGG